MGIIVVCTHCHNFIKSGRYCGDCNTAEKRRDMDEANRKLFAESGKVFVCHECDRVKKAEVITN